MRWWPKKKEREENRFWTEFRKRDHCAECGNLEKEENRYFVAVDFNGICPECGSEKVNKVVGRWEISILSIPMAMTTLTEYHKSEIRDNK